MRNPLIQYLVGAFIFGVGLIILLSASDIAHGLAHFWDKWAGRRARLAQSSAPEPRAASYRARLMIWRILGALILVDGLVWLALATAEVFHVMPRAGR